MSEKPLIVVALNLYLQQVANQDQKRGLTRVYVLAVFRTISNYSDRIFQPIAWLWLSPVLNSLPFQFR